MEEVFRTSDGLIVLDQLIDEDCGVVNAAVRGKIDELARRDPGKLVFVDSPYGMGTLVGSVDALDQYILPASTPWMLSCGMGMTLVFGPAISGDECQRREDSQRVTFRSAQPGHCPLASIVSGFAPQEGLATPPLFVRGTRRPGPYVAFEPSLYEG